MLFPVIAGVPEWVLPVVCTTVYVVSEYWLGRTDKVQSGSVPELVLNILKVVCGSRSPKGSADQEEALRKKDQ